MLSAYVCECGFEEGSACQCPPGHVRSWVRDRLVAIAHLEQQASRARAELQGHRILPGEASLAAAIGVTNGMDG